MTTKITKLKLDNVGGFKDFELDFHDKLTVLIGNNGSGKTTILSSIALLLDLSLGINLEKNPDNNFLVNNANQLHFANQKFSSYKLLNNNPNINIDLSIDNNKCLLERKNRDINGLDTFKKLIDQLFMEKQYLPLFVYYPAYNAPISTVEFSDIKLENEPFAAYISACGEGAFDANRFFNWFRWQENIKKEVGDNNKYEIVRQAIYQVLNDNKNTFDNLRITWLKNPNGDLFIDKNDIPLNINQLSAGEKMLLILVADLARRLIVANPESENPLHGDGVILIDEIDLHLHPSWQRKIVHNLTKIFKNCQFIISTHSDLILSEVYPENIIKLENFKALYNTQHTKGRDANSIRSDIMGVSERSPDIQEKLQECFDLIDDEKILEAEQKIEKLEEQLGPNDPDVVYIHSLISFHKE